MKLIPSKATAQNESCQCNSYRQKFTPTHQRIAMLDYKNVLVLSRVATTLHSSWRTLHRPVNLLQALGGPRTMMTVAAVPPTL